MGDVGAGGGVLASLAVTRRQLAGFVLGGVVLGLVALSGSFGRAYPTGGYRPDLPPEALTNGCWPLPAGVELDFPHQVRTDGDGLAPGRRRLVLQYDVIDAATARMRVSEAFRSAGFEQRPSPDPERLVFEKTGVGTVSAEITPLTGAAESFVVRGWIVLDLPSTPPVTDDPVCGEPFSTKRFTVDEAAS